MSREYLYRLIVGFWPADIAEIDRILFQKQQEFGKVFSRNRFISEALQLFKKSPSKPLEIHRANLYRREDLGGRRNITLLQTLECIEIIKCNQEKFKTSQMEIIRQAVVNKVIAEGIEWSSPFYVIPKIEQKWCGILVAGVSVNERLNMKRNSINVLARRKNIKYIDDGKRRYYFLSDLVIALNLKYEVSAKLFEYYSSEDTLKMQPIESYFL